MKVCNAEKERGVSLLPFKPRIDGLAPRKLREHDIDVEKKLTLGGGSREPFANYTVRGPLGDVRYAETRDVVSFDAWHV